MQTWKYPEGIHSAQIDHILCRGNWMNSVQTFRAYSTIYLGPDNRIITANLKICF